MGQIALHMLVYQCWLPTTCATHFDVTCEYTNEGRGLNELNSDLFLICVYELLSVVRVVKREIFFQEAHYQRLDVVAGEITSLQDG